MTGPGDGTPSDHEGFGPDEPLEEVAPATPAGRVIDEDLRDLALLSDSMTAYAIGQRQRALRRI